MIKNTLLALVAMLPLVAQAELPVVQNAFIAPTPPGAKVAAAFMTFRNNGNDAIEITTATSPAVNMVEIHLSTIVDDVASMQKQDSVQVPAGGSVAFKHGGYHFMLMGLETQLVEGDTVPLIITTSAGVMYLDVPVGQPQETTELERRSDHSTSGGKEVH